MDIRDGIYGPVKKQVIIFTLIFSLEQEKCILSSDE